MTDEGGIAKCCTLFVISFIMAAMIAFGINTPVAYAVAIMMLVLNVVGIVLWLAPHVGDRCRRFKGKMQ